MTDIREFVRRHGQFSAKTPNAEALFSYTMPWSEVLRVVQQHVLKIAADGVQCPPGMGVEVTGISVDNGENATVYMQLVDKVNQ